MQALDLQQCRNLINYLMPVFELSGVGDEPPVLCSIFVNQIAPCEAVLSSNPHPLALATDASSFLTIHTLITYYITVRNVKRAQTLA